MDSVFGQQDALSSSDTVAARVTLEAIRAFGTVADEGTLSRYATTAVGDLWHDTIKVKTFVPVLAMREVRAMLERRDTPVTTAR